MCYVRCHIRRSEILELRMMVLSLMLMLELVTKERVRSSSRPVVVRILKVNTTEKTYPVPSFTLGGETPKNKLKKRIKNQAH